MKKHAMIDIESLGVKNDENPPVILSIGVVIFDPDAQDITQDNILAYLQHDVDPSSPPPVSSFKHYYAKVSTESCLALGMVIEDETMQWWAAQPIEAQEAAFSDGDRIDIGDVLKEINVFLRGCDFVWAKDPDYDLQVLERAASRAGKGVPWKYSQKGAVRTAQRAAGIPNNVVVTHHALMDALDQAAIIQQCNVKLGGLLSIDPNKK